MRNLLFKAAQRATPTLDSLRCTLAPAMQVRRSLDSAGQPLLPEFAPC